MSEIDALIIAREVIQDMMARLEWIRLHPQTVIVMGAGKEEWVTTVQARYPAAMIRLIEENDVNVDAQSVDLILANMVLPGQAEVLPILKKWATWLRPEGLLMLNALGPDTLAAWHSLFRKEDLPYRIDMHEIGDQLLQAGLADPVLDVDFYTFIYRDQKKCLAELHATGMLKRLPAYHDTILHPAEDGKWRAVYEMIFAHAFCPAADALFAKQEGVVSVPLDVLRKQLKAT